MDTENDPCPQIKDVIVSDYFFEVGDEKLGRIPLISEMHLLAGFAELTAVVYFGDSAKTSVEGSWSGVIKGDNKAQVGNFRPDSVLYFPNMKRGDFLTGKGTFTASNNGASKKYNFTLKNGKSWRSDPPGIAIAVTGGRVYITGDNTYCLDTEIFFTRNN